LVSQLDLEQLPDLYPQTFLLDLELPSTLLFLLDPLLLVDLQDRSLRDQQRIELVDEEVPLKITEIKIKIDLGMLREEWRDLIMEEVEGVGAVETVLLGVGNVEETEGIVMMNMGGGNRGGRKKIGIEVGNDNEGRGNERRIESTRGNERGRERRTERRMGRRKESTISSPTRTRKRTMEV